MICPHCKQDDYTRIRQWYFGHRAIWWCDYCMSIFTPGLTSVVDHGKVEPTDPSQ